LAPAGASSLTGNSFGMATGSFNVNGSQTYNTITHFDGAVDIRTRANNSRSIGVVDLDSTEEVQVLTGNYSAEYGRESGGEICVVSKSGTSVFHGDLYEYFLSSGSCRPIRKRRTEPQALASRTLLHSWPTSAC
jgi:outer membrane receptor protein involved in Fe transport